jgi:hypothetical protein
MGRWSGGRVVDRVGLFWLVRGVEEEEVKEVADHRS